MLTLAQFQKQLKAGTLAGAREIRLSCALTEFPAELFEFVDTLEILDIGGNQLRKLPDSLSRFRKLRVLFASGNPMTEFPSMLNKMPSLEMIGFKACQIRHVPENSLPPHLRWLILTDNQLERLPESIGRCQNLQKLMLSCNRLDSLPMSLAHCSKLEMLRIASNCFERVPEPVFQLPSLSWLALAGNPITQKNEQHAIDMYGPQAYSYQSMQLHELLGEGASGHIYQASYGDQAVALKVFKAASTSDGTPQSELAAGLAAGTHPNLLTPLAKVTGMPDSQLAMALPLLKPDMQPLAGPPSFASCTRDVYAPDLRLSTDIAQKLIQNIRAAVQHLHQQGLLHGDLYAHNTLCNLHTGEATLSDMGAAALLHGLPETQKAQLQAMELRALRILEAEIQALTA